MFKCVWVCLSVCGCVCRCVCVFVSVCVRLARVMLPTCVSRHFPSLFCVFLCFVVPFLFVFFVLGVGDVSEGVGWMGGVLGVGRGVWGATFLSFSFSVFY